MIAKDYIVFKFISSTGKTDVYDVLTKQGLVLGQIRWYGSWRKYCFFPTAQTLFDAYCLDVIRQKLSELMEERKNR